MNPGHRAPVAGVDERKVMGIVFFTIASLHLHLDISMAIVSLVSNPTTLSISGHSWVITWMAVVGVFEVQRRY